MARNTDNSRLSSNLLARGNPHRLSTLFTSFYPGPLVTKEEKGKGDVEGQGRVGGFDVMGNGGGPRLTGLRVFTSPPRVLVLVS